VISGRSQVLKGPPRACGRTSRLEFCPRSVELRFYPRRLKTRTNDGWRTRSIQLIEVRTQILTPGRDRLWGPRGGLGRQINSFLWRRMLCCRLRRRLRASTQSAFPVRLLAPASCVAGSAGPAPQGRQCGPIAASRENSEGEYCGAWGRSCCYHCGQQHDEIGEQPRHLQPAAGTSSESNRYAPSRWRPHSGTEESSCLAEPTKSNALQVFDDAGCGARGVVAAGFSRRNISPDRRKNYGQ